METRDFDTLAEAIDYLKYEGYKDDFKAEEEFIVSLKKGNKYKPEDLTITEVIRFEGKSNPADSMELFAIKATDGAKGTLVMAYGAKQSQNVELIRKINIKRDV